MNAMHPIRHLAAALAALVLATASTARAELRVTQLPGGALEARIDGEPRAFPLLSSDMRAHIQGDLASVALTQVFENPYDEPMHARYVFPLPSNAAVHAMRMVSGDRMIEAEIRRKPEARAVYEKAKKAGKTAALTEQHRPNVFTQEVANLMPGVPVRVEIEYAHVVEKRSGAYTFHFPMVVGPRYLADPGPDGHAGAPSHAPGDPEPLEMGVWRLPASSPVAPARAADPERVSIRIQLDTGMPIRWLESPSHRVEVERAGIGARTIQLAGGRRTADDGDFVLRYALGGDDAAVGATTWAEDGQGFLSLLVEPPTGLAEDRITPRELVFVLDCSGSMSGVPLEASKRFMRRALARLRPSDHFRIIRFSDAATSWSHRPLPATPEAVRDGLAYVDTLRGGGGTVMTSGIRAALDPPIPDGALRIVVFLTDGYIGNDVEVVRLVARERGDARLFSFGVGHGVNRYLIREMARAGRGAARIVLPHEDAERAADDLADRLDAPALTDVEIDWGDVAVEGITPARVPDLFLGQSLRVIARYYEPGTHQIVVKGRAAGEPVELPLELVLPVDSEGSATSALPILWARAQVEDRMIDYLDPARSRAEREDLKEEVTGLGLAHRLVTQWTSFVAVAREVVNPGGPATNAEVAVPRVKGVPDAAYPPEALPAGQTGNGTVLASAKGPGLHANPTQSFQPVSTGASTFHGSAAPEPGTWIALAVLLISWGAVQYRARRREQVAGRGRA